MYATRDERIDGLSKLSEKLIATEFGVHSCKVKTTPRSTTLNYDMVGP